MSDINKRKAQLKALNGGKTYRMLLDDYYPALRRIDYTLAYIARPFDVNEAKQVIKTETAVSEPERNVPRSQHVSERKC